MKIFRFGLIFLFMPLFIFYHSYSQVFVELKDSTVVTGIIISETDDILTLRLENIDIKTILKTDILNTSFANCTIKLKGSGTELNGHIVNETDSIFNFIEKQGTQSQWHLNEISKLRFQTKVERNNEDKKVKKTDSRVFIKFPGYDLLTKQVSIGAGIKISEEVSGTLYACYTSDYKSIGLEASFIAGHILDLFLYGSLGVEKFYASNFSVSFFHGSFGASLYNFHIQYGVFNDSFLPFTQFCRLSYRIYF